MTTASSVINTFQTRADLLTAHNMKLVPITNGAKGPPAIGNDWPRHATNDPETLARWAEMFPTANTALVATPDTVCVFDADSPDTVAAITALNLPETF